MAEQVGLVFQDFESQLFSTNVELEIAFGPENFGLSRKEITKRIKENLAYIGFESLKNRSPATLSGGQKQKLAIASVLAMNPKLLVPGPGGNPASKDGSVLDREQFELMKDEYYQLRGWDVATGFQTESKLTELGLKDVAAELKRMNLTR